MPKSKKNKSVPAILENEKLADPVTTELDLDMEFDFSELDEFAQPPPQPEMTSVVLQGEGADSQPMPSPPSLPDDSQWSDAPAVDQSATNKQLADLPDPSATDNGFHGKAPMSDSPDSNSPLPESLAQPTPEFKRGNSGDSLDGEAEAEGLRLTQKRVIGLETQVSRLIHENESLSQASMASQKRSEDYLEEIQTLKTRLADLEDTHKREMQMLREVNEAKEHRILELVKSQDILQAQLDGDRSGSRKREKDLAHKLEIVKMEEAAIIKSKDQLILDLKRKIDRHQLEAENFRKKGQVHYQKLQDKNKVIRGVVRALRIALVKLDSDSESSVGLVELENVTQEMKKSG